MGLGANGSSQRQHGKQHPRLPATTDQVCSQRSQPSLSLSLGQSKISRWLWRRQSMMKAGRQPLSPLSSKESARKPAKFFFQWSCASNTIKDRLAICAQDRYWAIHRQALICLQRITKSISTVFFSLSTIDWLNQLHLCLSIQTKTSPNHIFYLTTF